MYIIYIFVGPVWLWDASCIYTSLLLIVRGKRAAKMRHLFATLYYSLRAPHCNTLRRTATHCNTLQHGLQRWGILQGGETAQEPGSLLVVARNEALYSVALWRKKTYNLRHPMHLHHFVCVFAILYYSFRAQQALYGNILQHTATCCNMLPDSATHCNMLQHLETCYLLEQIIWLRCAATWVWHTSTMTHTHTHTHTNKHKLKHKHTHTCSSTGPLSHIHTIILSHTHILSLFTYRTGHGRQSQRNCCPPPPPCTGNPLIQPQSQTALTNKI